MKKALSLLLVFVMLLGLMPMTVFAEEAEAVAVAVDTTAAMPEAVPYYGRTQLAGMSNAMALLYAYDQIVAGVAESAESIDVYNGADPISTEELELVMDAYRRDYAHHFWLGNSYSYSGSTTTVTWVRPKYIMSGTDLENAKAAFNESVEEILSGLTATMTEFERELYLHDVLAGMVTYTSADNAHNAYGALVEGKAVCEGYAEALQYLLQRAGIQSFIAIGTGNGGAHAWNYVRIDGEYYHVDLTWNDQGEKLYHAYFNQTDDVIQEDHEIGTAGYTLPVCDATDAMYFTGKDTYLDNYTASAVGQLLKENGLKVHVYIPGSVEAFREWLGNEIRSIAQSAGVSGGFSYGCSYLGREWIIYLKVSCSHEMLTFHPGVEATCTKDGYAGYYVCECGKFFADAEATSEISDFDAWKRVDGRVSAFGHEYVDGECVRCGEEDPNAVQTGDANADGNINYLDAIVILQYYTDEETDGISLAAADVNGDEEVNYLDAMMILQYYVGDLEEFPAAVSQRRPAHQIVKSPAALSLFEQ